MKNKLQFYLPFLYLYKSRLGSLTKFVSWIIIYLIPVLTLLFFQTKTFLSTSQILSLGLWSIFIVYTFYEIGYIQNDTETIKSEASPTLRLSKEQFEYYYAHRTIIYFARFMIGGIALGLLKAWMPCAHILYFMASLGVILVLYQLYNYFRGDKLWWIYFILVTCKYIAPLFLFATFFTPQLFILSCMIFPLPKTLESKCTRPISSETNFLIGFIRKNILHFDKKRLDGYRVVSYGSLLLTALFLWGIEYFPIGYVCLSGFIFMYRLLLWLFIKKRYGGICLR